jgi:hypothetical protein
VEARLIAFYFAITASTLPSSETGGWLDATVSGLSVPWLTVFGMEELVCAFLFLLLEQPLKSSMTISAITAVAAAVAAPPIIRARFVGLFTIGLGSKDFELKDFDSEDLGSKDFMFVSPPLPWQHPSRWQGGDQT